MTEQEKYILIDTPDKKALFGPRQKGDEWKHGNQWTPTDIAAGFFSDGETYRRPERLAWLKIADNPVQYPAWVIGANSVEWFDGVNRKPMFPPQTSGWTHWQPAPAAPEPPVDEDEVIPEFEAWLKKEPPTSEASVNFAKLAWKTALAHARTESKPQAGEGKG